MNTNTYYNVNVQIQRPEFIELIGTNRFYLIEERDPLTNYLVHGTARILLPKDNEGYTEIYRQHRNAASRERDYINRTKRNKHVSLEEEYESGTSSKELIDETAEKSIFAGIDRQEFRAILDSALVNALLEMERDIIELLYLVDEPLSVKACAETLNHHERTIKRHRDIALDKLKPLFTDFADSDF